MGELEKHSLRTLLEIIGRRSGIEDIGRLKLDDYIATKLSDPWPNKMIPGNHHMGTTKMSDDPKLGVVDRNCLVHGLSNLYVAGSSCFPTSGSANPTYTLTALSLRLSDHLKKAYNLK